MNDDKDIAIINHNSGNNYSCPNCQAKMNKMSKGTAFFHYYRCPNCRKIFRKKKSLNTEESLFLIGEQLQKVKEAIYCITFIIIIWFTISFFLTFIIR